MDPVLLSSLISSAPSLLQGAIGIGQNAKGKKFGRTKRPDYTIPTAYADNILYRQNEVQRGTQLPGQDRLENEMDADTATAISNVINSGQSPAAITSAISALHNKTLEAKGSLYQKGLDQYYGNLDQMQTALMELAGQQEKKWEFEKRDPYLNAMRTSAYLQGAGAENMFAAFDNLAAIGTAFVGRGNNQDFTPKV